MKIFSYLIKALSFCYMKMKYPFNWSITLLKMSFNQVDYKINFVSNGVPCIKKGINSKMNIGNNFHMNNGHKYNLIGRQQQCIFVISYNGILNIGDNVGMSATAIVCWDNITIKDGVRIGGGTVVYDTDFHSLDFNDRLIYPEVKDSIKTAPIVIEKNAFIGAHCIILKGVTIGENSIIGAGSVVTKSIPKNEIWGGNPAKFIRKIEKNNE